MTDDEEPGWDDPSPAEIAERSALIRAGWSDTERQSRVRAHVLDLGCDYAAIRRRAYHRLQDRLAAEREAG